MTPSTTHTFRFGMGAALACGVLLAGCGGDSETPAATSTTAAPEVEELTVQVVAEQVGLGCTSTAPVGNGSQLVVLDAGGDRVGVGTFGPTPGSKICDWTATVEDVPADVGLVVLEGDRVELVTVDPADEGWTVMVLAGVGGLRLG